MEPDFLPGSLKASHTADYLLHFHLSAVVLCLSFLVSDFLSLFLHIPLDWGPFKDKKPQAFTPTALHFATSSLGHPAGIL